MRNTDKVLENYRRYSTRVSVQYLADGKLDANELDMLFKAVLANQAHLARALQDVYAALGRVERETKNGAARGPVGL